MGKEKVINKINKYSPCIITAIVFIINAWFLIAKGAEYIDSDMASNLQAGFVFNSEKVFMSKNWFYSTVLAFMASENFYQLGFLLFPHNWIMARATGVIIMLLLQTVILFFFAKEMGESVEYAILFAAFSMFPMSFWYMLMVTFGGYYTANVLFSFLALLLIIVYGKTGKVGRITVLIIAAVLGILLGMAGIKYLLFPYGPICLASLFILLNSVSEDKKKLYDLRCVEWKTFISSIISTAAYMMGYGFNMVYLSKKYHFESHNDMCWGKLDGKAFFTGIAEFLSLYGYQEDEQANSLSTRRSAPKIFSIQGIATAFGLLIICYLIFSIIRLLMRYNKLSLYEKTVLILLIATIVVDGIIFKWTEGFEAGAQYWVPAVPLGFLVMIIECRTEEYSFNWSEKSVIAILTICLFITSFSAINQYEEQPLEACPELVNVAKWLTDNGYTQGYSTFWQGNSLTALSNGELEMWVVTDFDTMYIYQWLQKTSHMNPPDSEKLFAVIGRDEDRDSILQSMSRAPGIPEVVYEDEAGYVVVEYK